MLRGPGPGGGCRTARRKFLLRVRRGYLHSLCGFSNISMPFRMTVVRRGCGSSLCGNGFGRSEWCCIIGSRGEHHGVGGTIT